MEIKFTVEQAKEFERLGVKLLILFGSAARGETHPLSDLDVGVVFADSDLRQREPVRVYGDLLAEVQKIFPESEKIDLIYLDETALGLRFRAASEGQPLYERSAGDFYDYRERVMLRYCDFRYYENLFHQAVMNR